ncbi:MAG: hypothetical protein JW819_12570 [Candidatus Krumholzibacteriota bacterium]|nr:hypothetical protein [Candidatus Krumholzibacteriota bacterium]
MIRRALAALALALPVLLLAVSCSDKTDNPFDPGFTVFEVPSAYATIQAAAAQAEAGDRIVVTGRDEDYNGDVLLPAGVILMCRENSLLMPVIRGGITAIGSSSSQTGVADLRIEGFRVVNEAGSGILLQDCQLAIVNCWIDSCAGAAVEIVGDGAVAVSRCDLQACATGVLIRDVTEAAHYPDAGHPAGQGPSVVNCNFLDNLVGADYRNLVFESLAAADTAYVNLNYWGGDLDTYISPPDSTIIDHKDDSGNPGYADTEGDGFQSTVTPWPREWRD